MKAERRRRKEETDEMEVPRGYSPPRVASLAAMQGRTNLCIDVYVRVSARQYVNKNRITRDRRIPRCGRGLENWHRKRTPDGSEKNMGKVGGSY